MIARRRAVAVLALGAVALALAVLLTGSDGPELGRVADPVLGAAAGESPDPPNSANLREERVRAGAALGRAVALGERHDAEIEAAVMLDGWHGPVARASTPARTHRRMRAWSMSKVVAAVALLSKLGWADRPGVEPSREVAAAMRRALVRSENCRQRRVVLELQALTAGTDGARAAVTDVLARAGARTVRVATQFQPPQPLCVPYLTSLPELADPYADALLLGTTTWTIADAARFAHALGTGAYGDAVTRRLLALMSAPKRRSGEITEIDFTAPLNWGAGEAFEGAPVAYKAGWGGTLQGSFLAGQILIADLPDGSPVAIAIAFHPHTQPARDDPGVTAAPTAIAEALRIVRRELETVRSAAG